MRERPRALLADDAVRTIFEATFAHEGTLVRVDVLEKTTHGAPSYLRNRNRNLGVVRPEASNGLLFQGQSNVTHLFADE